jgi:hypothetical protein
LQQSSEKAGFTPAFFVVEAPRGSAAAQGFVKHVELLSLESRINRFASPGRLTAFY